MLKMCKQYKSHNNMKQLSNDDNNNNRPIQLLLFNFLLINYYIMCLNIYIYIYIYDSI